MEQEPTNIDRYKESRKNLPEKGSFDIKITVNIPAAGYVDGKWQPEALAIKTNQGYFYSSYEREPERVVRYGTPITEEEFDNYQKSFGESGNRLSKAA